jgi:uncharacterized cupredoxin-like copper-binding protein
LSKSPARALAAFAATTILAAGCGGSQKATTIPPPKGDVQAVTYDYEVLMPSTLTPGVHTIGLTNKGLMQHEFVMFKTDLSAFDLPLKANGDVNEDSPLLTKVADSGSGPAVDAYAVPPGHTESFQTDDLTPGHYVAICNLPKHYKLGMAQNVTVK